jgi:hypothetical protein
MLLWILRVVLPAIIGYWFGRLKRAIWDRLGGSDRRQDTDVTPAEAVERAFRMNAVSIVAAMVMCALLLGRSCRWQG